MSDLAQKIQERIQQLEAAITQSLANHNALLGALSEVKHVLTLVSEVSEAIAPASPISAAIATASTIVNEADSALIGGSQSTPATSASSI